ncbi:MAG: hypothetical protein ACI8T1_002748 [Verrucomicrobiales bacterium]
MFGTPQKFFPGFDTSVVVQEFEADLLAQLNGKALRNELDVLKLCFKLGVKPQHARPIIQNARKSGVLTDKSPKWVVPNPKNHREPRSLHYC